MSSKARKQTTKTGGKSGQAKNQLKNTRGNLRERNKTDTTEDHTTDNESSEEADPYPTSSEKKKMLSRFVTNVGKFETLNEVSAASQWLTSMGNTKKDQQKYECFNVHAEKIGLAKVWAEIIMYRSTGQISTYFLDGQNLRGGRGRAADLPALDELEVCAVGWTRLAAEGKMSRLEQRLGIEDGEGAFDSHAARLRSLIRAQKASQGFERWDYAEMKRLRYEIYRVVGETTLQPTDMPIASYVNRSTAVRQDDEEEESLYGASPQHSDGFRDVEQLRQLCDELKASVHEKGQTLAGAEARANLARVRHNTTGNWNEILDSVRRVMDNVRQTDEDWTVDSAHDMAERFSAFGQMASDGIKNDLVAPLAEEDEAKRELRWAEKELAEVQSRLHSMERGRNANWEGQQHRSG